jgi:tetratricopeptide (TPR) repeat protein
MGKVSKTKHEWEFPSRFRRNAFGWKSQPPIKRIKEAVREIKKTAKKDPLLGAEGAVLFLEKVSPAIQNVDSSSGAIGSTVNWAIEELAAIIAAAPADDLLREKWLQRLWQAIEDDDMPYLELLAEHWGEMCATKLHANRWVDKFIGTLRALWNPDTPCGGWFKGTYACLSALYTAERYDELFELIELDPHNWWSSRYWGVKALAAQGEPEEAIRYAEETVDPYTNTAHRARTCEEILLSNGNADEAYARYALAANRKGTHLATFKAIVGKYPDKDRSSILNDLVEQTPGEEGKWFAAAKSVGLYEDAIKLAKTTPCDPRTLTRAARDFAEKEPRFAMEAGLTALRWLLLGYGYDIIALDVSSAYWHTMAAAANADLADDAYERVRRLLAGAATDGSFAFGIIANLLARGDS